MHREQERNRKTQKDKVQEEKGDQKGGEGGEREFDARDRPTVVVT